MKDPRRRASRSSSRRRSAERGMWPASIRRERLRLLALLPLRSPASVRSACQPSSPSSAERACALRCGLGLQLGGERGDPGVGGQGLALDRDAADLALARALDALAGDAELVARSRRGRRSGGARASRPGPTDPRRGAPRGASGQRGLELRGQHLERDAQVAAVGAQAGRGEVERLLLGHPMQATPPRGVKTTTWDGSKAGGRERRGRGAGGGVEGREWRPWVPSGSSGPWAERLCADPARGSASQCSRSSALLASFTKKTSALARRDGEPEQAASAGAGVERLELGAERRRLDDVAIVAVGRQDVAVRGDASSRAGC